ncbi:hypothetical protein EJ110_NYTH52143 [Nymphaea thermarum]|nr:hypothetical protein EJ110_NYTH52143 [Nymphaea thermarum]
MVADSVNSHPCGGLAEDLLPHDVAHHIASLLPVSDLCSLGSTSRTWRDLCSSDRIWSTLSKDRWPAINLEESQLLETTGKHEEKDEEASTASIQVWKGVYVKWHREMADRAATVVKFVTKCSSHESLEVGDYLKAVKILCDLQLGFKDVQLYIFTKENNVLLNLIGLHYSIFMLQVQTNDIAEALCLCRVSNRRVCVRWWKLGRWVYGFRQRDEVRVNRVSLLDILKPENQETLWVLERGVVHEVLRVQISTEDAQISGWEFNFQHLR